MTRHRSTPFVFIPPQPQRTWLARIVLLIGLCSPLRAAAEPTKADDTAIDQARELGEKGVALYRKGKCKEALPLLERAEELHHAPTLVLFIARCHDKLGRLISALGHYRAILGEELPEDAPPQYASARAAAFDEVDLLIARIPTAKLTIRGAAPENVTVTLDGNVVPRTSWPRLELDPGEHTFEATGDGYVPAHKNVIVPEGDNISVELTLGTEHPVPPPPEEAAERLPLYPAWIALGTGGAGLLLGAITGGLHLSRVSDLESRCNADNRCPASDADEANEANTLGTMSTASFIAGGVLAVAGGAYLTIALLNEPSSSSAAASIRVGPTGLSLSGRF